MSQQTAPVQHNDEIIVGLDIGTTKICAIVGRRNEHGKLEILGMGKADSQGVLRGDIVNIEKTITSIRTAIQNAEANSGVEIKEVYVGIAGQHIKSMQSRGQKVRTGAELQRTINKEDIDDMIADMYRLALGPGEQIIHVLPQDFIVDGMKDVEPIGMEGNRLEANFHIILGQYGAIQNIKNCVERAGVKPVKLILEPLASSASVLSNEEKEAGIVLVDIGGGTTDIAIFQDNIIRHTHVIPAGGNVITDDIKNVCRILPKQAEQLKTKYGSALSAETPDDQVIAIPGLKGRPQREISMKNLARIIEERMSEILEVVYNEIIRSGYDQKIIGGIKITGGGAKLANLKQLTEYITRMDADIGLPAEHISGSGSNQDLLHPMYATAIGLVLKGFEDIDEKRWKHQKENIIASPSKKKAFGGFSIIGALEKIFIDKDDIDIEKE